MTSADHATQIQRVKEASYIQSQIDSWVSLRENVNRAKGFGISSFANDHRLKYVTGGPIEDWQCKMCTLQLVDSQFIKSIFDEMKRAMLTEIDNQIHLLQAKYAEI
jgi:hypothetical protein